jgi:ligand-binding SRPBCC domain-containing protein
MYQIRQVIKVKASLKEVWSFYSNPQNLEKVTPEGIGFRLLDALPEEMYTGLVLRYIIKPIAGIPIQWATEITHISPMVYFVDHQLSGPYKIWHHQHHFEEIQGGCQITDIIHYELPLGILGKLAHVLFVKKQLTAIFAHREKTTLKMFGNLE